MGWKMTQDDIERICRLARELNIPEQDAVIKYGEYKALDEKVGNQNKAYERTVNHLTMMRIRLNSIDKKYWNEDCMGL